MRTLVLSFVVAALLAAAGGTIVWSDGAQPLSDGDTVVWGN